ncbi:MAG: trehalose-phosphatase, partial [Pseudomonadota bacterium]
ATMPRPNAPPPPLDVARDALFLDYDGTLCGFTLDIMAATIDPAVANTLQRLAAALDGALGVITGRPLKDLDALAAPLKTAATGQHGHEVRLRPNAEPHYPIAAPKGFAELERELRAFEAAHSGVVVEAKGRNYCVHYRRNPAAAEAAGRLCDRLAARCDPPAGRMDGHLMTEITIPGAHKGVGLRILLKDAAFAGRRPVFFGDDISDEDGFRAATDLGGHGVLVGDRDSAAVYRVADVDAVHAWLRAAAA